MVDDVVIRTVERFRQPPLGNREPDTIRHSLTKRPCCDLDARCPAVLRMTGCSAVPLSELLDVGHGQVIAGEKQQAVQQHAAVAGGQHETVAVGPGWVPRIVSEMPRPQDIGHGRGTHRHTRMPRLRVLNGINGQHPDRIDAELVHVVDVLIQRKRQNRLLPIDRRPANET